jgi:hypothetical protein
MTLWRVFETIVAGAIGAAVIQSPAADQHEYGLRDGNRMEGLTEPKTTGPGSLDLRVASFLGYREPLTLRQGDHITVAFYVPSADPIEIEASEIVARRYYSMKPTQKRWPRGWQVFSRWPAAAVLIPLGIDISNIGIVGRIDNGDAPDNGFLVPLLFYVRGRPASVSAYELQVVSREVLSQVRFSISTGRPERSVFYKVLRPQSEKFFDAGVPIALQVPVRNEPAGWLKLEIEARIKDHLDGPARIYHFFHQPAVTMTP